MPNIIKHSAKSFVHYLEICESLCSKFDEPLWFRGVKDSTYDLTPTLYRHKSIKSIDDANRYEDELRSRFRERCIPFVANPIKQGWDELFLMQHHGVPTRLLDWSHSSIIALFFACMNPDYITSKSNRRTVSTPATVWILNPTKWNQGVLSNIQWKQGVLTPDHTIVQQYEDIHDTQQTQRAALCIYGSHNSARIVAQRGAFTVFGKDLVSMNSHYVETSDFASECLHRIDINKSTIPKIQTSLVNAGYGDSVLFPDLDGLAKELKRSLGFPT